MGVSRQIAEDLVWSAKRRFGIDYPFLLFQRAQPISETDRVSEVAELAVKVEFACVESFFQEREKFAAEKAAERLYRQEELFPT